MKREDKENGEESVEEQGKRRSRKGSSGSRILAEECLVCVHSPRLLSSWRLAHTRVHVGEPTSFQKIVGACACDSA